MRIRTDVLGSGSAPPGSKRQYTVNVDMVVTIPEPTSAALIGIGMLSLARRRR